MGEKLGPLFPCHRVSHQRGWGGGGVSHLTALGQGKATTQKDHDIPRHFLFYYILCEEGRRSLQLPWVSTPQAEEGGSPGANRLSLPSPPRRTLQAVLIRELNAWERDLSSATSWLCPENSAPSAQLLGFVYSADGGEGGRVPEGRVWPRGSSLAPGQVLTWFLSQPWDLGGHDEHNYSD